jgi:hypothetical protein
LQVGAYGDEASIGNVGVRAEIRTNLYYVNSPSEDSFWVGDVLSDGAFIQFGYIRVRAGSYCSYAKVMPDASIACSGGPLTVDGSDALLFWLYSSNISKGEFYYGLVRHSSLGTNGTWHLYSILSDPPNRWMFLLDTEEVADALFPVANSSDRVFIVAEKSFQIGESTFSTIREHPTDSGPLGPVEFRNAAYLKHDGWHPVTELYAVVNCGVNPNCPSIPYGVTLVGPNHIIAGTSIPQPDDGRLLWSSTTRSTMTGKITTTGSALVSMIHAPVYVLLLLVAVSITVIMAVFLRKRREKRT